METFYSYWKQIVTPRSLGFPKTLLILVRLSFNILDMK